MTSVFCVIESRVRFIWYDWKDSFFHFLWLQLHFSSFCVIRTHTWLEARAHFNHTTWLCLKIIASYTKDTLNQMYLHSDLFVLYLYNSDFQFEQNIPVTVLWLKLLSSSHLFFTHSQPHCTVQSSMHNINLKSLSPGQLFEFKPQQHSIVN